MYECQLIPVMTIENHLRGDKEVLLHMVINLIGRREYPECSMQIHQRGDEGEVYALMGEHFVKNSKIIMEACRKQGLAKLTGDMIPFVAQALRRRVRERLTITGRKSHPNGVKLDRVVVDISEDV